MYLVNLKNHNYYVKKKKKINEKSVHFSYNPPLLEDSESATASKQNLKCSGITRDFSDYLCNLYFACYLGTVLISCIDFSTVMVLTCEKFN